jgi:hypothetical protein
MVVRALPNFISLLGFDKDEKQAEKKELKNG